MRSVINSSQLTLKWYRSTDDYSETSITLQKFKYIKYMKFKYMKYNLNLK